MARRKGDEKPDDTSPAPSELGELHCCSVADVRLSPASDRIAAHSADSGLCQYRPKCGAAKSRLFNDAWIGGDLQHFRETTLRSA